VEDPVEYQLKGVNQIQVNEKSASPSRAACARFCATTGRDSHRRNPRCRTAQIAVQRRSPAIWFFPRCTRTTRRRAHALVDMASALSRRLVAEACSATPRPRACKHCKQADIRDSAGVQGQAGIPADKTIYKSIGCRECRNTGFFGRHAIFEWMDTTSHPPVDFGKRLDRPDQRRRSQSGMRTLAEDGWRLSPPGSPPSRKFECDDGERSRERDQGSIRRIRWENCRGRLNLISNAHIFIQGLKPTARLPRAA